MCLPIVDQKYSIQTWCPRQIKREEGRTFTFTDNKVEGLDLLSKAINTEKYLGSIKFDFYTPASYTEVPNDRLMLRGRKPLYKKIDKSLSLNFEGRVKKASRKNIQIVRTNLLVKPGVGLQIQNRFLSAKSALAWSGQQRDIHFRLWVPILTSLGLLFCFRSILI